MRNFIKLGSIVGIAWFAAAALTPLTSVAIRNSTVDSTAIGSTTASSVRSTYVSSTAPSPSPSISNSSTMGWNGSNGGGDTDFVNNYGASSGGFYWSSTGTDRGNAWSPGTAQMSLDKNGYLSVLGNVTGATAQFQNLHAGLGYGTGNGQGAYVAWNQSAGTGETDFINSRGSGVGGFSWYNAATGTSPGSALMSLDSNGILHVSSVAGAVSGNSATASAFNHTPSTCGAGFVSTGVDASGNAVCSPDVINANGTACTTGSGSYSTCLSVVSWSPAFADNNYRITCTMVSPSDPRAAIVGVANKFNGSANVTITTEGSTAISFANLDCMVQHN